MSVELRVKKIVGSILGYDPAEIPLTARFDADLRADSADILELLVALGEEFEIEILEEDAEKLLTVGDLIAYIEKLRK